MLNRGVQKNSVREDIQMDERWYICSPVSVRRSEAFDTGHLHKSRLRTKEHRMKKGTMTNLNNVLHPLMFLSGESTTRLPDNADRYWIGVGVFNGWGLPLQLHEEELPDAVQ